MRYLLLISLVLAASSADAQRPDPFQPLIAEAWQNNLSLRQERLDLEKSDATVTQARGLFLPSVNIDSRYSQIDGGVKLGDLAFPYAQESHVRAVQPLFNPSVVANYQIRRALRDGEQSELKRAARQLAADVQLGYVNYARAARIVDLYQNTLAVVNEAVRVNERLLQNGKITPAALHRAIADRSEIEQQIAQATQQRDAAARYFNYLLGRAPSPSVAAIADSLLFVDSLPSAEMVVSHALSAREELAQVDHGIRAAQANARLATSSFLPSVAVAFDYGLQGDRYRFDSKHDMTTASLVLSWNVFNGGQDAARREQAQLDVERGRVGRKQAEQQIELEVRQAHDAALVARQAISTAHDRLNAASRTFELVQRRYSEGMATQLEFLDARTTLTNAQLNWILTQYNYAASTIELERVAALRNIEMPQEAK